MEPQALLPILLLPILASVTRYSASPFRRLFRGLLPKAPSSPASHPPRDPGSLESRLTVLQAANEQLIEANHRKDHFIHEVAHELRTPIANIRLLQGLSLRHPDREAEYAQLIEREAHRLQQIINNLALLASLDAKRPLETQRVRLCPVVNALVTDRQHLAAEHGLTLRFTPHGQLPRTAFNRGLVEQAVDTLIANAIKFTPAGGEIYVYTHASQLPNGAPAVAVSVRDTGPGLAPDEVEAIFQRFTRGSAATKSNQPGSGLGLAIAREIVACHGGHISAYSVAETGRGACFTITLPIN